MVDSSSVIGQQAGSAGNVTVTGTGSTWTNSGNLTVGGTGTASLTITSGGQVSSSDASIGNNTGSTGSVTVTGPGSSLNVGVEFYVGNSGTGTLMVANGGTVSDNDGFVGAESTGTVTVTGSGSYWNSNNALTVGSGNGSDVGSGVLNITNGGAVNVSNILQLAAQGSGSITIDGTGSLLQTDRLWIGNGFGTGTLAVTSGGTLETGDTNLGLSGGAIVTVSGTGSVWNDTGILEIGYGSSGFTGTGTLIIADGGAVNTGTIELDHSTGSSGERATVDLEAGGTLNTGQITVSNTIGANLLEFNGGKLVATASGTNFIGSDVNMVLESGGGTIDNNGNDITINASMSGTGGATFTGTATTTLTTTNTYAGATVISSGTLALVDNGSIADSSEVDLTQSGATLDIKYDNGAFTHVLLNNLTGTADTFINTSGQILVVNESGTTTFAGIIQNGGNSGWGGGSLTLTGTGTLKLTGSNTYSGETTISSGVLAIGNASALGDTSVTNNGTLMTADDNRVINITGNYIQGANATLQLNLYSASDYDQVQLTGSGTATLNGKLTLVLQGSFAPGAGQSYTLIATNNAITGSFTTVTTNIPTISGTIDYTNNATLLFQGQFVTQPGLTPNQAAIATYIDTYDKSITNPNFAQLIGALNNASADPATLQGSLNQLSPLNFANFASSNAFNNASFAVQGLDNYLANHRGADGTFVSSDGNIDYSGLAVNDPNIDPGLQSTRSRLLAWSPAPSTGLLSDSGNLVLGGMDMKDVAAQSGPTNLWNVFITGNVILAQDFSDNAAGLPYASTTTGAAQIGVDYKLTPHLLVGVAFGYGHTHADLDSIGSNANVNTYSPSVYLSYSNSGWYYNALGSYGFSDYSQNRSVAIGAFNGTAHSSPGGSQIIGDLDGGYDFHKDNWTFGPTLGVQYTHLDVDGYTETGLPGADLTVNSNSSDSLRSHLGGRVSYAVKSGSTIFTPHLSASWQHEFMDQSRGITSQFNAVGAGSFVVNTPNPSRDSALVDVGVDAQINNTITVFSDYSAQAGQSNYFGQSVQAGVKIGF